MIHLLLNLTRPLFITDTETTGTNPEEDRVVEIGFQRWEATGMTREWRSLINPLVPIPASASRVHGITNETVLACRKCGKPGMDIDHAMDGACEFTGGWPSFKQIAVSLASGFTNCDFGGQSVRFDLRILAREFQRAGVEWSYIGARILDSYALETVLYGRDLSTLHEKYVGLPHDDAHGALADVRASATVIAKQLEVHADKLPRDLDALHALQWPGWLTADGSFKVTNGIAWISFGKHKGKPMQDVPASYYDFILTNNFPADVKALAAKAKLGQFPEVP